MKRRQLKLIDDLRKEEARYAQKTGAIGNISNSMLYLALLNMINGMDTKIAAVEHNISIVKITRLGFRHGLKGFESELENEKRYFRKLKQEYNLLNNSLLLSGGSGYNFTAFLKLLLQTMEIKENVLQINKNVRALMNINILFAK
ncbi:hypothetical protein V1387_17985 [Allomuricauda taeanensis]|uniref:hypothetical protein n=1 Tax=Flagellimonas taeanensis TaxID=1005926 RepID=UPI002E7BBAFC|nr:hypothetical protein [Allomuricauda taeanensis]MEE1964583.1 hypothetical protein [Allomuricauda taeanensis]